MLKRFLAPAPALRDADQLRALTLARFPRAAGVNEVDTEDGGVSVAVYYDGFSPPQTSLDAWRAEVAAHVPTHPTPTELADLEAANSASMRQKLIGALAANAVAITDAETFLATAKPATAAAQAAAAYDQAKVLTQGSIGIRRQLNALIRLTLGLLDSTAGT